MSIDGISGKPSPGLVQFRIEERSKNTGTPSQERLSGSGVDDVSVSSKGQEFLRVRKMAEAVPDVRLDRVNQLAQAIETGKYNPRADEISSALIDKHLIDFKA